MSFANDQTTNPPSAPGAGYQSPGLQPQDDTSLREDLNALRQQFADFVARASTDAMKTAKQATTEMANQVGSTAADVANQVGGKASDLASAASEQAKTLTSELERFGRSNPLGAIA